MPARAIPIQTRSVTGKIATLHGGAAHRTESSLESDFARLMVFDLTLSRCDAQPLRVDYLDEQGTARFYHPDFLVQFLRSEAPGKYRKPLLIEIKYHAELRDKAALYAPRFAAARREAQARGWSFVVFTERDIRTPYLENVRFLLRYFHISLDKGICGPLLEVLLTLGHTSVQGWLETLCGHHQDQARLLPYIWQLVARRAVGCDLFRPLTMTSAVWSAQIAAPEGVTRDRWF